MLDIKLTENVANSMLLLDVLNFHNKSRFDTSNLCIYPVLHYVFKLICLVSSKFQ